MNYKNPLWNRIDKELLPFVNKPARYTGNELHAINKPHSPQILKWALCFPEMYEIGMSYLGMKILYHLINSRKDCLAERAFMVWPDMEARLKELGIPLFSLESSTPLTEFDVLGFHLTYEMNHTALIAMLELAGIPIYSRDRDGSHPLVLAGGPSVINPEPVADFIDAFYIGDAEEAIFEIADSIKKAKDAGIDKGRILEDLAKIPGIYVPQFYQPEYDEKGKFKTIKSLKPGIPETIKIRSVPELKDDYYPGRPVVPFIETSQDHLSVEIMRGCVRGCRFCQAGYQYRPRRQREVNSLKSEITGSLSATGYDDVTLLSLSSTDFQNLDELLESICPVLSERKVGLGLPSLRPETITPELLNYISITRKSGLTLAPEAGTETLRKSLGKDITDEQVFSALETAVQAGWQTIKLYFMIGLPGETGDDIEGIASILRKVSYMARQASGKVNINVSISPYCPKSHTPWQWEGLASKEELEKKIEKIAKRVKKSNIKLKFRDLDLTLIEASISRGDRRIGEVIQNAYLKGARLDGWSEFFDVQRWLEAFEEAGIDITDYTGELNEDSPLPWDHIDKGISKEFLKKDNHDSKEGILPKTAFSRPGAEKQIKKGDDSFGRKAKRTVKRSTMPKGTYRLRVRYSIGPELRFLSHLDNIRTIFRAIRRSGIPVAFSEGFNPHQKISFGPPLPVGYSSDAEYFDMVLTEPLREEFIGNLSLAMPEFMKITGHKYYFAKPGSLVKQLNLATYEVELPQNCIIDNGKVESLLSDKRLRVIRTRLDDSKEVEAGEFIEDIRIFGDTLETDLLQTPDGHIKPDELLIFGLGLDPDDVKRLVIHRKNQHQKFGGRLIEPLDLV